jgi:Bardet-Biedl syndrome 5 protein
MFLCCQCRTVVLQVTNDNRKCRVLELCPGEFLVDSLNSVEDTKGNNGDRGILNVTNLRMIWVSHTRPKTNLSVGYAGVVSISIRPAVSKLRGNIQALYVFCKFNGSRFEFIFTNVLKNTPRLFTTVQAIFRSYETTRLYRDMKLRGAIVKEKQLIVLPGENVFSSTPGVWNLSSEQGNLGTLVVTSFRVVWYANLAENFNVSIPFLQMKSLKVRNSKFGAALVVETSQASGGYILGFHISPLEQLTNIAIEVNNICAAYYRHPDFGIRSEVVAPQKSLAELTVAPLEDDMQVLEDDAEDPMISYMASEEGGGEGDEEPVYCAELGVAIEPLPPGKTLQSLWSIA